MGFWRETCQVFKTWQVWCVLNSNQEVKVVFQQTIGESFRKGGDVFLVEFEEMVVIAFLVKEVFPVVAAIVDVVIQA